MRNICVIEDNIEQAKALKSILYELGNHIYTATSYEKALELINDNTKSYDMFFIDIELSDNHNDNGIKLGGIIRSTDAYKSTPVIYITALPQHVMQAVNDVHCYNYITKPYTKDDIAKIFESLPKITDSNPDRLKVCEQNGVYSYISYSDITYITRGGRNLKIHTINGIYNDTSHGIIDVLSILPDYFVQCHKSFIVNLNHIIHYDKVTLSLTVTCDTIKVGRKYKEQLEAALKI